MNHGKAVIIANKTSRGISVIDIQVYNESGRIAAQSSKRLLDSINKLPLLDENKLKTIVAKQYGVPLQNIVMN